MTAAPMSAIHGAAHLSRPEPEVAPPRALLDGWAAFRCSLTRTARSRSFRALTPRGSD